MAKKSFEIQGAKLRLGGLDLEAGTTNVVIPGITAATTYFVEEVEGTDVNQANTFIISPIVIDDPTYNDYDINGTSTGRAEYACELDGDGYIDKVELFDGGGTYTDSDIANANMWAYIGTESNPFTVFTAGDWIEIPFRPVFRAGTVDNTVTSTYKFETGIFGTKDNPDTGGWGDYNMYLDPGGESDAGIEIPRVDAQISGSPLIIYNNQNANNDIQLLLDGGAFTFKGDGSITFPNNAINSGTNSIELKSSNYSSLWFHGADGVWQINPSSNQNAYIYVQDNGAYIQNYRGADGNGGDTWDYTWEFNNNGNLTLPQGGTISETTVGINPTIVITPAEADSLNQALYIKGGLPPEPTDYHLHLTTGDLTDTSIIVGTDDHNIRTAIDGGIELNSYNYNTSTQHTLTFGTDGAITTNEAFAINVSPGIPDSISNIASAGGWNSSPYTNLATTGGTGTGLTVNASSEGSGYLDTITINTAGSGYANGDVITIENENNLITTFTIGIASPSTWEFGEDGGLTFPDATVQTTAWTGVASEGTTSTTSANVGYIGMPQNPTSTSYTLAADDQGKHIYVSAAGQTITVPSNETTAFPIGTTIAIIAGPTANPVTIAITSDTMYLGGVGSTGTRTLAAYGMATLVKVAATTWFINGSGLS